MAFALFIFVWALMFATLVALTVIDIRDRRRQRQEPHESPGRRVDLADIVKEYLDAHGFDGLYSGECACSKDDLCPCDSPQAGCSPGYETECDCGDHEYHIGATAFVLPCGHVWSTEDAKCLTCDAIAPPAPEEG